MMKCVYCSSDIPDGKFGFKMTSEDSNGKKEAFFCKACGAKMRAELAKKMAELKKIKSAERKV